MISTKVIQGELVERIQQLVGYRLYQYNTPQGDRPAVFQSNAFYGKKTPSSKMPYIAVDFLQIMNPFHRELYEGYRDENDWLIAETKIMQFTIRVYGSGEHDTLSIASELSSRLKMGRNRDYFKKEHDVGLYSVSNPTSTSQMIGDEFRDMSSFSISFSYIEEVVDNEDAYEITRVDIDTLNPFNPKTPTPAGLYEGVDDESPLPVDTGVITKN